MINKGLAGGKSYQTCKSLSPSVNEPPQAPYGENVDIVQTHTAGLATHTIKSEMVAEGPSHSAGVATRTSEMVAEGPSHSPGVATRTMKSEMVAEGPSHSAGVATRTMKSEMVAEGPSHSAGLAPHTMKSEMVTNPVLQHTN